MRIEKTTRRNGKWAKVSGSRGAWTVALGWQGELRAHRMQHTATRLHADCIATNYLND